MVDFAKANPSGNLATIVRNEMKKAAIASINAGASKSEAVLIAAFTAMSPAVGFAAAAMGKREPTLAEIDAMMKKIIAAIDELPAR